MTLKKELRPEPKRDPADEPSLGSFLYFLSKDLERLKYKKQTNKLRYFISRYWIDILYFFTINMKIFGQSC